MRFSILRTCVCLVVAMTGFRPRHYFVVECKKGGGSKLPKFCGDLDKNRNPESFLWRLERHPPVFFFGTLHVPYTLVWDSIPDNVKEAYEMSMNVIFELDMMDPLTVVTLNQCQLLPRGDTLAGFLPPDMYSRLQRHFEHVKKSFPLWVVSDTESDEDYLFDSIAGNWERKKPIWVVLLMNSITQSGVSTKGIPVLDIYLAQKAERQHKKTGAIERAEEQCSPLDDLDRSQIVLALNQTLRYHEDIREGKIPVRHAGDDLIRHYNCGSLDDVVFNEGAPQIPSVGTDSMTADEKATIDKLSRRFKDELIYQRNRHMGARVLQLLRDHPDESFFFAFGVGHFLGNFSVLDVLEQCNLKVVRIPRQRNLKRWMKASTKKYKSQSHMYPCFSNEESSSIHDPKIPYDLDSVLITKKEVNQSKRLKNFRNLWIRQKVSKSTMPD